MKKLHLLAAAVTVALASTLAVAQTTPSAGHARPDANGDRVIDRSEAAAFPKLASRFVKHPSDVVRVGDTVKVWVEKVDRDRKKISLTMVQGK